MLYPHGIYNITVRFGTVKSLLFAVYGFVSQPLAVLRGFVSQPLAVSFRNFENKLFGDAPALARVPCVSKLK